MVILINRLINQIIPQFYQNLSEYRSRLAWLSNTARTWQLQIEEDKLERDELDDKQKIVQKHEKVNVY